MCLVPVQFCFANRTIGQPNGGNTFYFSPLADTILPVEPPTITNALARGDDLDVPDLADNLELHKAQLNLERPPRGTLAVRVRPNPHEQTPIRSVNSKTVNDSGHVPRSSC